MPPPRLLRYAGACLLLLATFSEADAGTLRLAWTSDYFGVSNNGLNMSYGPDGPWQALAIQVGNSSKITSTSGLQVPMYPCGSGVTQLPPLFFDAYSKNWSANAVNLSGSFGNPDDWWGSAFMNGSSVGPEVFDDIQVRPAGLEDSATTNVTLFTPTSWIVSLPDGSNYIPEVGILGVGSSQDSPLGRKPPPTVLAQLKEAGTIGSQSFGLHMGSAPLNQSGSLLLGGYAKNRALGQVGVFEFNQAGNLPPFVTLLDVNIGVETGGSPFNVSNTTSVYKGNDGSDAAKHLNVQFGAPIGASMMVPNPVVPYIYLPRGTCEALAEYLPTTWHPDLGLYTWNTDDPSFERIVNSPAYLQFVFADRSATNTSIKVPFKLLNLTLTAPITKKDIQYLPCMPFEQKTPLGWWSLGRAFLQAAFMGVSYEQNLTFLAQAPGPDMDQEVDTPIKDSDTTLDTNSISTFEKTWSQYWTPLPGGGGGGGSSSAESSPIHDTQRGLTTEAKAGIAVGVVLGVLVIIVAAYFLWMRHKKRKARAPMDVPPVAEKGELSGESSSHDGAPNNVGSGAGAGGAELDSEGAERPQYNELGAPHEAVEMGKPLPHEADSAPRPLEGPLEHAVYEMPARGMSRAESRGPV